MNDDAAQVMTSATAGAAARPTLARAVALLHMAIIVLFTVGWLLPWNTAYWLVIGGGALLPISWALFDNNCPLTRLERQLAGTARDAEPDGQNHFVSRLLSRVLGRPVSDRTGDIVVYAVLISSMSICAARLTF